MPGWTQVDIPDQAGRMVVITGADSGLGFETALALARKGARVLGTSRSTEHSAVALARIRAESPGASIEFAELDLADLASVRDFAGRLPERTDRVDVFLNNAGIMGVPERLTTSDGFELQLGTNHLGPFALTALVFPLLARSGARVVTVTSGYYGRSKIDFDDLQSERKYGALPAYGQSKLANVLFMHELARRAGAANLRLISLAAHPGLAKTNLQYAGPALGKPSVMGFMSRVFRMMGQPAEQGALPSLYASTAADVENGSLYGPDGRGGAKGYPKRVDIEARGADDDVATRLWAVSEELTGVPFAVDPAR